MRLIDADELKKKIDKFIGYLDDDMIYRIKVVIDNAPTVELDECVIQEVLNKRCMTVVANEYLIALHGKRPQGEWIRTALYGETCYECNKCNRHQTHITKFCPNCGAEMRGKPNQLRDCENCVHHSDGKGCESWECEFKKRSDV